MKPKQHPSTKKLIFLLSLWIIGNLPLLAQVSCSSGQALVNLYTGYGKTHTVNSTSYVTNGMNAVGMPDAIYATVRSNSTPANRGVLTLDLVDNIPNLDTLYFVASGSDGNNCTWDVSVSSNGSTFSSVRSYSISSTTLTTFSYVVNNASGARYIRFASTSSSKHMRLDAAFYNKKNCMNYCRSASFSHIGGFATANFGISTATNPSRALGAPNPVASSYCRIDGSAGQVLNLDLGAVVPYGTYIQLFLANDVSGTNAVFQVTASDSTISFTNPQSFTARSVRNTYTDYYYQVTQTRGVRYIQITVTNSVAGVVDAVSYKYPSYWGKNYISGTVFLDPNINAVKDGGETGASGITVLLSKDYNNNGAYDPGDTAIYTTTTGAGGVYEFLLPTLDTNYLVSVLPSSLPVGNQLTGSNELPVNLPANFNNTDCDKDFGYFTCSGDCPPVAVNDNVFATLGSAAYITVAYNDYDPNNNLNISSVQIIVQPKKGEVFINAGVPIYTPTLLGTDTFSYRIADLSSPTPLWDTAIVVVSISPIGIDACAEATISHLYYIPAPEQDIRVLFQRAECASPPSGYSMSDSMRTIISIKCPYPGVAIYYDHWEDGYEATTMNPVQATTQVWGDGNIFNGIAPGYPYDIIPSGGSIILDNIMFYNPRNPAQIKYDARDKLFTTEEISLSRISWDKSRGTVQAYSVDVYDLTRFGTSFNIPVGKYTGSTNDFQYVSLFVRAALDNTTISIDVDNDGDADTTATLQEGESFFQNGNVKAGAAVASTKPVGVDVFFGDSVECFNAKELNVLPATFYGDTYYSPVPTTKSSDSAVVMFYNPLSHSITINWNTPSTSGSFNIAGKGIYRYPLGPTGYKFKSAGGETYVANELVDAWRADGSGSGGDYDWAFALIPENRLTSFSSIAWAPGSDNGTQNGNPVWVTAPSATTIYVKWNGNVTGTAGSTSPCGLKYDVSYTMTPLQVRKLLDAADKDQSGLAVYTCNYVKLACAYGEDPSLCSIAAPYIDAGTSMQPLCNSKILFANDDYAYTVINTPVNIDVLDNDTGFTATIDPSTLTTDGFLQPTNGTVTVNPNGTLTYTPNPGFEGEDTLEYFICSDAESKVCDVATVIILVSACPTPSGTNLILGQVFWDRNMDGINNDGGLGIANCKVYLYTDGNCSSTVNPNELTDSVTVDSTGYYQFMPNPEKITADNFDGTGGARTCADGSDGNTSWLSNWVDSGDPSTGYCNTSQTAANTDVEIIKDGSFSYALRLKDNDVSATRTINLNNASAAFLSFSYRRKSSSFTSSESIAVQMSPNGSTWTTIHTITGNSAVDAAYIDVVNQNVLAYASATTYLRFLTSASNEDADSVYIDNIHFNYLKYPQCYITKIAAAPAGYTSTNATQYPLTATSAATCLGGYDFGFAKNKVTVSGTLYNDLNGLTDGLVNGTAFDAPPGVTVYAYLLDSTGYIIFKDTLNNGNGTYSFSNAEINTTYTVMLSTNSVAVGTYTPETDLPHKWGSVGDAYGTNNREGTGNEAGTPNSSIIVKTSLVNVTGVNFGIQRPDAGTDKTLCWYPGSSISMTASTTPGTWTAQYDNPDTSTINNPTSATTLISNLNTTGTYNFVWTNGDVSDTVTVVVNKPEAGADQAVCAGTAATLTGENPTTGTWSAQAGNPAGATLGGTAGGIATVSFAGSAAGAYNFIYTSGTCKDTMMVTVPVNPDAGNTSNDLTDCANSAGYIAQLTAEDPSPITGTWVKVSGPGTIVSPSTHLASIAGITPGMTASVRWIVSDTLGCQDTSSTMNITAPLVDTSLVSRYNNHYCLTCPVQEGNTYTYYDANGKILMKVTDPNDANGLGSTEVCADLAYPNPASSNPGISDVPSITSGDQPYLPRSWSVNPDSTDASYTVSMYFTDEELNALMGRASGTQWSFSDVSQLHITGYPNESGNYTPPGGPNGTYYAPIFTRVGDHWVATVTAIGARTFYLHPIIYPWATLPVELVNLNAQAIENYIRVNWATASELNNDRFEIERSTDGKSFSYIGNVKGGGTIHEPRKYFFDDKNAEPNRIYYYRLKQVDYNGAFKTSNIVSASIKKSTVLKVSELMPNPTAGYTSIQIHSAESSLVKVTILSMDGKQLSEESYQLNSGVTQISLQVDQLDAGTYLCRFETPDGIVMKKLIKSK